MGQGHSNRAKTPVSRGIMITVLLPYAPNVTVRGGRNTLNPWWKRRDSNPRPRHDRPHRLWNCVKYVLSV